ncbi:Pyrroline-5-carboxylate reductase protein [Mesorhizobium sp. SOD10]|nr:Pyrroline-5-carboxylate reductase protein [Mesorhizobium sp. SOD10]
MTYGFIGSGTITEAMVAGLMASPPAVPKIVVSPRNAEVAARLAARYSKVEVAPSNQAVVDAAGVLVLAIRPQIAKEVLEEISIPQGRKVISVIAATSHEKLAVWTGQDPDAIVRAIPLPFVADREGVTALYPPDAEAEKLFGALGSAVVCESKDEFNLLAAISSMMATYFGIMERTTEWLAGKGMSKSKARNYLTPLFGSLTHVASRSAESSFGELRQAFSTRGGLNEQLFKDFDELGGTAAMTRALDRVLERIRA